MKYIYFLSVCFFTCASICLADTRPNIVFIMADDMGSGDVQALNPNSKIPTPNLNRLAGEGMTFTDAHSPSAVCTPTRYGLMTGRYCWRSPLTHGVLNGYGAPIIERDRETVASFLKKQGYATGIVGKWHLGLGFQKTAGEWDWAKHVDYSPVDVGFDYSLVIPASLDFPPYVYVEGHTITGLPDRIHPGSGFPHFLRKGELGSDFSIIDCLDTLTQKAANYINDQSKTEQPFFLYFPLTAPHKPAMPHSRFKGKTDLGPYGDFVMQVDWTVGQVLKAIDDAGIYDNTLVIYTSDNGSYMYRQTDSNEPDHVNDETVQGFYEANHTANGELRGTKADIWEAGHRVPFFVRWPGKVNSGSKSDRTITHTDFFATAAEVVGSELPPPTVAAQDSFSFLPLMIGNEKAFKRAPVIHHSGGAMFAIRDGDWKLVLGNGSGGRQLPKGNRFERPWSLFNMKEDLSETEDRYNQNPSKAKALELEAVKLITNNRSR
ncbi:MAG: arylsulfatase [Verrucomicrobia bacterium]|nr:arylsulfatase [Verrucomicrobiota bacterium]MDA1065318.1 arylsulfatase [Verrucomicrobiota bacterium]